MCNLNFRLWLKSETKIFRLPLVSVEPEAFSASNISFLKPKSENFALLRNAVLIELMTAIDGSAIMEYKSLSKLNQSVR